MHQTRHTHTDAPREGTVQIWLADSARLDEAAIQGAGDILSSDEQARAGRFRGDALKARFVAGRAMLRTRLADELELNPRDLTIGRTAAGKPILTSPDKPDLDFSLSYAGSFILLAIGRDTRVGVDIEPMRSVPEAESIVARHFAIPEKERWQQLPASHRPRAFLEAWTRKEAVLKATGVGLSQGLAKVQVTFGPGSPARVIEVDDNHDHSWQIEDISTVEGYVAALVSVRTANTEVLPNAQGTNSRTL